jgi:hypothetical protein
VPQQLAECKNLPDLYRVYAQFFQNACSQYQSGLEQMTKLDRSMAENAFQATHRSPCSDCRKIQEECDRA